MSLCVVWQLNRTFWLDLGVVISDRKGWESELLDRSFIGYYNEGHSAPKDCYKSLQNLQSEYMPDLLIVRILLPNPIGVLLLDFVPQPISKVGVELSVGVESVASLDHLLRISALHHLPLQDLHGWEVVVDHVEVLEGCFSDDLFVNLGQVFGAFGGEVTHCVVAVEPTPAGTDLQAVEEVINSSVGHIERMRIGMQIFIKQITIAQTQHHEMTSRWYLRVKIVQQLEHVPLEIRRLRHGIERFLANVVANQLQEHNKGVVILLIPLQSLNVSPGIASISSVHTNVLEIVMVAQIPISEILIDRMRHVAGSCVTSIAGFVGKIQLICQTRKQIRKSALPHQSHVEVLLGDGEVRSSGITNNSHSISLVGSTELILVQSASIIQPENTITILVGHLRSRLPARIHILLDLIAVRTTPVIASEGGDVRVGIVIHIESREMAVAEMIHEQMDQPFPRGRGGGGYRLNIDLILLSLRLNNAAIFVLAHAEGKTDLIGRFPLIERLDDEGTGEVNESLAGGFDVPVEEGAELVIDKIGDAHLVVVDVVVHNAQDDHAECAGVVETVGLFGGERLGEIGVCAGGVQLGDAGID